MRASVFGAGRRRRFRLLVCAAPPSRDGSASSRTSGARNGGGQPTTEAVAPSANPGNNNRKDKSMSSATNTRAKPSVMDGLKEREQKWTKAQADADALGRDHGTKLKAAQALIDERRRAVHPSPELVDRRGQPISKDNRSR
jgi:hypothetical protein